MSSQGGGQSSVGSSFRDPYHNNRQPGPESGIAALIMYGLMTVGAIMLLWVALEWVVKVHPHFLTSDWHFPF